MAVSVQALLRVRRVAADLARARDFYCAALGFTAMEASERGLCRLHLGAQSLDLVAAARSAAPYPPDGRACDLWFQHIAVVTTDMPAALARLRRHAPVPITLGEPPRLPPADGSAIAYKFRDPDGHPVELIQFAGGTRRAGIDHTAISVADIGRSLDFYCGVLGLSLGGRVLNQGPAQDRLDGLAGATVDVVALHPAGAAAPHVELLGYRHPRGRAAPPHPGDIAADRMVFAVADLAALLAKVPALDTRPALVRDPDGHLLELCQVEGSGAPGPSLSRAEPGPS